MDYRRLLLLAAATLGLLAGCGKKEITSTQRKEAAMLESEAQFALTVKDLARAEGLLTKAAELVPDTGEIWLRLGSTRMKLGQRDRAKDAYENGLEAFKDAAKANKASAEPWLQQVTALALLGRADDARALVEKTSKRFPNDAMVRDYIEAKTLDRMLSDPSFKELAL